jgi:hypothetical protein
MLSNARPVRLRADDVGGTVMVFEVVMTVGVGATALRATWPKFNAAVQILSFNR